MWKPALLIATMLLGGCHTVVETYISSAGEQGATKSNYVATTAAGGGDVAQAHAIVAAKLAQLGMTSVENGVLRLDVAFSTLPAEINLRVGEGGATLASKSRRPYPQKSRRCSPVHFRLGVALTRIADGAEAYRASATERNCAGNAAAAMPLLADAALADFGAPKGDYIVARKLKR